MMSVLAMICILGNSVSLVMRPPRQTAAEQTYAEILRAELACEVINWSQRAAMISDGVRAVEDVVITRYPQAVVIQYGIVECTLRDMPRWLYQFVKLRLQGDENRWQRLPVQLAARTLMPLSRRWAALRGRWRWMEPQPFAHDVRKLVQLIRKETSALPIVINIPTPSERVERLAPGTSASAAEYNRLLALLAAELQVPLLDAAALIAPDPDALLPDGIHFSASGHRLVADQIKALIGAHSKDGSSSLADSRSIQ